MMRPATEADRSEIEAFLAPRSEVAMFPLSNLLRHGMQGGHPNAVTFWVARRDGQITDVLTRTEAGMVLPVLPSQDFAAAASALKGRAVTGIIGAQPWARGLQTAMGLTDAQSTLDRDEPHFLLRLSDLKIPDGPGQIAPLGDAPPDIVKSWFHAYMIEALQTPIAQADIEVHDRYDRCRQAGSHVCLMEGQSPLSMTGFNARLSGIVQVGGVYTPPELRGQGHARRALALHLAEAKASGVTRATLFAASLAASRAYQATGFRQIGTWTLLLLREGKVVHG